MNQTQRVFVVDDDPDVRRSLSWMLSGAGIESETYESAAEFLDKYNPHQRGCVLLDVRMPHTDGLQLQRILVDRGVNLPVILMSGHADVPMAVRAMEAGAVSFIEKPFTKSALLSVVRRAMEREAEVSSESSQRGIDEARVADLTPREREVMLLVCTGETTVRIARKLDITTRTVDKHREHILSKTRAESWAELVAVNTRLGLLDSGAVTTPSHEPPVA